ncbi:MAG TPA: hypothetical protein VF120_07935 [Ktedonobacterales bacterium]
MRVLKTVALLAVTSATVLFAGCSLGGAGTKVTPTATATSTPASVVPTPASGFTTFTSSDGVYGLNYPSDWGQTAVTTAPVVNGEAFYPADGSSYFMVLPLNTSLSADQYSDFASGLAVGFGGTGTQMSKSATTTSFDGMSWTEVNGTTTIKGTASEIKLYGTPLGSNSLCLVLIWPTASGSQVNTAFLQPMLDSFAVLKQS